MSAGSENPAAILDLLQPPDGEKTKEEHRTFSELARQCRITDDQRLAAAERALELLEEGRSGAEAHREVARCVATLHAPRPSDDAMIRLIDYLLSPCPQTQERLAEAIAEHAHVIERRMLRRTIADPHQAIERFFGIGAKELAEICWVDVKTVRRWRRKGEEAHNYDAVLTLAEAAEWLRWAGLDEEGTRRWLEAPHPELPVGLSPKGLLRRNGIYSSDRICLLAAERCRRERGFGRRRGEEAA